MRKNGVQMLLMGGQACVFYGAAEFSRDLDLLILIDPDNLDRLQAALTELQAEPIDVPQLDPAYLKRGHAVHFRCRRPDVSRLRIDLMSTLRGVDRFEDLWDRRTSMETEGEVVELLALEDLVAAKKTQRDKDWPMIRRLVEQHYFTAPDDIDFLFRELRTPELLIALAAAKPEDALRPASVRPAVAAAAAGDADAVVRAFHEVEEEERRKDRLYWEPLKRELEEMRHPR
jgi:hypothetical protein